MTTRRSIYSTTANNPHNLACEQLTFAFSYGYSFDIDGKGLKFKNTFNIFSHDR
jgi:hypothetical protein